MLLPTTCDNMRDQSTSWKNATAPASSISGSTQPGAGKRLKVACARAPVRCGAARPGNIPWARALPDSVVTQCRREQEHQRIDAPRRTRWCVSSPSSGSNKKAVSSAPTNGARRVHRVQQSDAAADLRFFGDRITRQHGQRRAHRAWWAAPALQTRSADRTSSCRHDRCRAASVVRRTSRAAP